MRSWSWCAGLARLCLLAALAAPAAADAASYPRIYAFGDSLTDAGNAYIATGGAEPISPPYQGGHFSNGRVWVQLLAGQVSDRRLTPSLAGGTDFAIGGAFSGASIVHTLALNDLPAQLALFDAQVRNRDPNALYVLWMGSNDLFAILDTPGLTPPQIQQAVAQVVANEAGFVTAVALRGAQHLLLVTATDLGKVPAVTAQGAAAMAAASALSAAFNQRLVAAVTPIARFGRIDLHVFDTYAALDALIADPAARGLTNVSDPCWTGSYTSRIGHLCARTLAGQNRYLFWDEIHPTGRGHALLAATAAGLFGGSAGR